MRNIQKIAGDPEGEGDGEIVTIYTNDDGTVRVSFPSTIDLEWNRYFVVIDDQGNKSMDNVSCWESEIEDGEEGDEYDATICIGNYYLTVFVTNAHNHQYLSSCETIDGTNAEFTHGIEIPCKYICVWDERPVDDEGIETEANGSG